MNRECQGCGCELPETKAASARYCSKQCGKNAGKRRATERMAKFFDYECPICGKVGKRRIAHGNKVVTCGSGQCVKAHKKALKEKYRKLYARTGKAKAWAESWRRINSVPCERCGQLKSKTTKSALCVKCKHEDVVTRRKHKTENRIESLSRSCKMCCVQFTANTIARDYCSDKCRQRHKKMSDPVRYCGYQKAHRIKMDASRPWRKVAHALRSRIREALSLAVTKKAQPTFDMLGYSKDDLMRHLESQFVFGMSWQNYGSEWHVDHVKPIAMHTIESTQDIKRIWRLDNLQPRYATTTIANKYGGFHEGNMEKGARYVG